MKNLNVVLVDRDGVRCSRWVTEFAKQPSIENLRCFEHLDDLRAMEDEFPFDICLIHAPSYRKESVIALLTWKRSAHPGCRTIVLDSPEDPAEALPFLEAGAWSCLPTSASVCEVMANLEAAVRGESKLSPALAGEVLNRIRWLSVHVPHLGSPLGLYELTPREREILSLVSRRMSNLEIAEALVLEVGTVKNHVHSVLKKLGVGNRYEAAAFGLQAAMRPNVVPA